jgi:hypothetical protein
MERIKSSFRKNSLILSDFDQWLYEVDRLYSRYFKRFNCSPFEFHEVSCVGMMACGAAVAGYLPQMEYEIEKNSDQKASYDNGRADLWFQSSRACYSFEFKRAFYSSTACRLQKMLDVAKSDIKKIKIEESDYQFAVLICFVQSIKRLEIIKSFIETCDCDIVYRIGDNGVGGSFIIFCLSQ